MSAISGEPFETKHLFQCISICTQRYNDVALIVICTLQWSSVEMRTIRSRIILTLRLVSKNLRDLYLG